MGSLAHQTVALLGTELASVASPTGGLERVVQLWADGLRSLGATVILIDQGSANHDGHKLDHHVIDVAGQSLAEVLDAHAVDVVVVNNRPFTDVGGRPRVDVFHNYPHGWDASGHVDVARLTRQLRSTVPAAVSKALSTHIETRFGLETGSVATAPPPLDPIFTTPRHHGGGGVLFPNRLMKKKGVAEALAGLQVAGLLHETTFLDYTTAFLRGSPEFLALRELIVASGATLAPACGPAALAERYAAADLVVAIATEPEGLGLVPLEAQGIGAPIVTAGPGGLAEATFAPNLHLASAEPQGLAEAFAARFAHPSPAPSAEVSARYGVAAATSSLEALLLRALDASKGSPR